MTPGTVEAIRVIRKAVAEATGASPGECLAGLAHELGFLIAFLQEKGENVDDLENLVNVSANQGGEAFYEAKEAEKHVN